MKTISTENSDLVLPKIGLGTMGFGGYFESDTKSFKASRLIIETAIERGITVVDTAEIYGQGNSEKIIGTLDKNKKNRLFIMSKFSPHRRSKKQVRLALEGSLKRLGRDWIDLYQPHWPDPKFDVKETLECLTELKNEGLIQNIGLSNFHIDDILNISSTECEFPRFFQCEFNPIEQHFYKKLLPTLKCVDGIMFGYSPFREGQLFKHPKIATLNKVANELNIKVSTLILAWILKNEKIVTIPKTMNVSRLLENLTAYDLNLTDEIFLQITNVFKPKIESIIPSVINPVDVSAKDNRAVYQDLNQAINNEYDLSPGPVEISEEIIRNGNRMNKPIKVRLEEDGTYTLVEGRLRYWGWIISQGIDAPIQSIIINGDSDA